MAIVTILLALSEKLGEFSVLGKGWWVGGARSARGGAQRRSLGATGAHGTEALKSASERQVLSLSFWRYLEFTVQKYLHEHIVSQFAQARGAARSTSQKGMLSCCDRS